MGAAYNYDEDFGFAPLGGEFASLWNRDFALDFDEVVPLLYTNILLVEDDPATLNLIKSTVKRTVDRPLRIRSFTSAEKAGEYISSLKAHHLPGPDVAIIDYLLSGVVDGLWLCQILEARFPETRNILISSSSIDEIQSKMDALHIKPAYFQKPFRASSLKNLLS